MIRLSTAGHETHVQKWHSERKDSGFFKWFAVLLFKVGLEFFRGKVNVAIFGNIVLIIKNALKIVLLMEETGLSNFDERISIFDTEEDVFESNFIILEDGGVLLSIGFDSGIAFDTWNDKVDNFLPCEVQIVNNSRIKFFLHIGKRIIDDDNDFAWTGKEAIRLFLNDV